MPVSTQRSRLHRCIAFVDMAGFTALTEEQGDEDAAAIATKFADLTRTVLGPGDCLVKTIGDAVLVTSPSAEAGVGLVERLVTRATGLPALRAGLHYGSIVERDKDVFGAAVNLAARVAAEAHAGEVLGTEPISIAAEQVGIPVIELGRVLLKNVSEPVPLYSLALVLGANDTPIDPVCHIPVDRRSAAGNLKHNGHQYWFCSLTCAAAFASNPAWHTAPRAKSA
jgi:adenylate cyclase